MVDQLSMPNIPEEVFQFLELQRAEIEKLSSVCVTNPFTAERGARTAQAIQQLHDSRRK